MSAVLQKVRAPRQPLEAASEAEVQAPMVLVVDPGDSSRSTLQTTLAREGFEVVAVTSAAEGSRQLAPGRPIPWAVVAEAELHGEDGFAFCGRLRAERRTAQLPILLLGRRPEGFHGELASGAGADDYLARPVFAKDVVALVRLATAPRGLDGALRLSTSVVPIPHLLRALLAGVRSGRLELKTRKGDLAFRRGKVIAASFDSLRGPEALARLLLLADGEYQVTLGPSLERGSMRYGLKELVSGAFPRILRWQALLARSVPLDAVLAVDFAQLAQCLDQLPDGINPLVRLFDGKRSVRDALVDSELSEATTLEVATRLYAMGVIAPVPKEQVHEVPPLPEPRLFEPSQFSPSEVEGSSVLQPPRPSHGAGSSALEPPRPSQVESLTQLRRATDPRPAPRTDWFAEEQPVGVQAIAPELLTRLSDTAELSPEAAAGLEDSLVRQLEAFRVPAVVERPVPAPVQSEVEAFARGKAPEQDASIGKALGAEGPPIPLTDVIWEPERASTSIPKALKLAAAAMLVAGAALAAWSLANSEDPARAAAVEAAWPVAAPASQTLDESWPVAPPSHVPPQAAQAWPITEPRLAEPPMAPPPPSSAPEVAAPTIEEGLALYNSGRAAEAAAVLAKVVEAAPSAEAWTLLGLARFDAGDGPGAEQAAMKALEVEPKNGRALILLASVYLDQGQRAKAEAELRRYLQLEPNGPFAEEARQLLSTR
ncbi:MAG: tetratricopeptide repeat protein [Myxococcales bacterium]|nr:tetratricopeptide repeat protein [Myxococcales bacterium]